ncbi:BC1872 family protein [Metabacillus sp. Hm71]|uniref:BC1872 family protein n=1 Tax=Metabacillus sp. Hm71 TaxID=3450743 RepID=UPI003F42B8D5
MKNREVDYLIATKVMGWEDNDTPFYGVNGERVASKEFFNPSDNIQDAWKVVEKLRKQIIMIDITTSESCYYSAIRQQGKGLIAGRIKEETATLAICKAALKTKGVDIE